MAKAILHIVRNGQSVQGARVIVDGHTKVPVITKADGKVEISLESDQVVCPNVKVMYPDGQIGISCFELEDGKNHDLEI